MKSFLFFLALFAVLMFVLWAINAEADEIDDLIPFVIQVESSGNPNAISPDNCRGLMQISEIVFREYLEEQCEKCVEVSPYYVDETYPYIFEGTLLDLYQPDFNKHIGTWYLRRLKDHYLKENYTIERMLAAYNGGPTRMRRLLREGKDWKDMPRESVRYVKKIMNLYRNYKIILICIYLNCGCLIIITVNISYICYSGICYDIKIISFYYFSCSY